MFDTQQSYDSFQPTFNAVDSKSFYDNDGKDPSTTNGAYTEKLRNTLDQFAVQQEEEKSTNFKYDFIQKENRNKITTINLADLPENVQNAYTQYAKAGWKGIVPGQTQGTKAGKTYHNDNGLLPVMDEGGHPINYREWDVNNKKAGKPRDGLRFVTGSDGSVYYTDSHYGDAISSMGIPPFVKINE